MHNWAGGLPPELQQAIKSAGPPILLSDTAIDKHSVRPVDIKRWCRQHLKTFIWMEEQDVSDVSLQWDYMYAFYIVDERDRNWFSLRWGS